MDLLTDQLVTNIIGEVTGRIPERPSKVNEPPTLVSKVGTLRIFRWQSVVAC